MIKKVMNVNTLINIIKKFRKEKGISQEDMANELGITQRMYSNYETGKSEMTLSTFLKIVQFLEIEVFKMMSIIDKEDLNTIQKIIDKYKDFD